MSIKKGEAVRDMENVLACFDIVDKVLRLYNSLEQVI